MRISGLLFAVFSIAALSFFNRITLANLPDSNQQSSQKWAIDPLKSRIGFVAKNMGLFDVEGEILNYTAEIHTAEQDFEKLQISFAAFPESLTTGNKKRDKHLKSNDFLYIEKYPEIRFVSKSFTQTGKGEYLLKGLLTLKDSSRIVELQVRELPFSDTQNSDAVFNPKRLHIKGKIDRQDFGLRFTGGISDAMVGDEIKIDIVVVIYKE